MHTVTLNIDSILWFCTALAAVGGAIAWILKGAKPVFRPFKKIKSDVVDLKNRKNACDLKFENDNRRLNEHKEILNELRNDNKEMLKSLMLLMKHAETGNCTGEVASGRKELEDYLIEKD